MMNYKLNTLCKKENKKRNVLYPCFLLYMDLDGIEVIMFIKSTYSTVCIHFEL